MNKIVEILMERDEMTEDEAWEFIHDSTQDLDVNDPNYYDLENVLHDEFGLEPDYVMDLFEAMQENPCEKAREGL